MMTKLSFAAWDCGRLNLMPSEGRSLLLAELDRELADLARRDRLRSLACVPGVNLCSNDYLGLSESPELKRALIAGIERSKRVSATGSRLLSGQAPEWNELEEEFSRFAGTEAALFFSSGYAANIGLLSAVMRRDDVVFSDELNHASLIDGIRLSSARRVVFSHGDLDALERALEKYRLKHCRKLIVTESVFSMDGDRAPITGMLELADRYGAELVVDEAHATGVHGPAGRGLVAALGAERRVFAVVHTCGKALASAGAFVCGAASLRAYLINRARTFIFSTALPPYLSYQVRAALELARGMDLERSTLLENASKFAAALRDAGFDVRATSSQIVPVVLGEDAAALCVSEELIRAGFAVRAIRPPTVPEGQSRLRLSLTCRVGAEDLDRLRAVLVATRVAMRPSAAARTA
jgi:8-amino-7-oxononanoate synthase